MNQTPINNPGWNRPTSSRRQFLRVAGAATALGAVTAAAPRAHSQTVKETEGMNAWTRQGKGYIPPDGFIPDRKTALRVGEAILAAVYGDQEIAKQRPLKVALVDKDVWLVWGTLDKRYLGGTGVIKISKRTGKVLFLAHGQ
ncbi:MAG: twin-arginine translocation signal domain-containing protein [Acidobacteriia bacterium]|nr:twin-arginine translocation signal domain-containing protein [Terriglobia bacterium]